MHLLKLEIDSIERGLLKEVDAISLLLYIVYEC